MNDPILHALAYLVPCIDVLMLAGALLLSYVLIRYRHGITRWYEQIKYLSMEGKS